MLLAVISVMVFILTILMMQWMGVAQSETRRRKELEKQIVELEKKLNASRDLYKHAISENKFLRLAINS